MNTNMSWIKDTVLVFIVTIISIKSADLLFGAFSTPPQSNYLERAERSIVLREFSPLQEIETTPTIQYMNQTDGLERKTFRVVTDEDGFIATGNERLENPELEILFLGGSTTETMYVEEQNRIPARVETLLRDQYETASNVYNGGVSGNHSMHSNLKLLAKGIAKDIDIAVLMHNINDLTLLSKTGTYWHAPPARAILQRGDWDHPTTQRDTHDISHRLISTLLSIKNALFPNLYAVVAPNIRTMLAQYIGPDPDDEFAAFRRHQQEIDTVQILDHFERSIKTFVLICKTWGIEPVLMTQFNRITSHDPIFIDAYNTAEQSIEATTYIELYGKFNEITREIAQELQVELIDLASEIPQSSDFMFDSVHLNDNGSRLAGDVIAPHLASIFNTHKGIKMQ